MAFITNQEREKKANKINKTYGGKKLFIIIGLILNIVFVFVTVLFFLPQALAEILKWNELPNNEGYNFPSQLTWINKILTFDFIDEILVIAAVIILILDVIIFVLVLSFVSPKKIRETTIELVKAPISGKKVVGVEQDISERATTPSTKAPTPKVTKVTISVPAKKAPVKKTAKK